MYIIIYEYSYRPGNFPPDQPAPEGVFRDKVISEIDYECNRKQEALFVAKEDFISKNGPHLCFELDSFRITDVSSIQI